jgi:hypothetical protein
VIPISNAVDGLFDLIVAPFGEAAAWALLAISLVVTVIVLLLFKAVTPQKRLVRARNRVLGHIYEMGLYQERLTVLARIQRDLAAANLRYVVLVLPALAVLIPPVAIAMLQLEGRVARRPFEAGETTLVKAIVAPDRALELDQLALAPSSGLVQDGPAVRARSARTVVWRVRVAEAGEHAVTVNAPGGESWALPLFADGGLPRVEQERRRESGINAFVSGRRAVLPADGALASLSLIPAEREVTYLGVGLVWWAAFILATLLIGLALKNVVRVEF